jgi:hypothetical protein
MLQYYTAQGFQCLRTPCARGPESLRLHSIFLAVGFYPGGGTRVRKLLRKDSNADEMGTSRSASLRRKDSLRGRGNRKRTCASLLGRPLGPPQKLARACEPQTTAEE